MQVNTTVMTGNADELADIAALVAAAGAHIWEVFFLVEVGRGRATSAISATEHEEVCHFLFDASRYGYVVRTVEAPFFRPVVLARRDGCLPPDGALYTQLARRLRELLGPADRVPSAHTAATRDGKGIVFVSSTGDVYPAGFLPLSVGNVREQPLPDIYTGSPLLRDIRAAHFGGRCGRCEYADLCGGSRARIRRQRRFAGRGPRLRTHVIPRAADSVAGRAKQRSVKYVRAMPRPPAGD